MTREKIHKKKTWFKNGKYESIFYVDATPDGKLAKDCQRVLNRCRLPVKVMEKTGDSIKKILTKSNPFKNGNCDDPNCPICLRECGINCKANSVVYQNYCEHYETCQGIYIGETASTIKERFTEHLDDARLRPNNSAMRKHAMEKHAGNNVEFKVKILGSCPGDALLRQCMEAVSIRDEHPQLNGRSEWGTGNGTQRRQRTPNNNEDNNNEDDDYSTNIRRRRNRNQSENDSVTSNQNT